MLDVNKAATRPNRQPLVVASGFGFCLVSEIPVSGGPMDL
jgi:hypothetical protein